jgi:hypothetical protein
LDSIDSPGPLSGSLRRHLWFAIIHRAPPFLGIGLGATPRVERDTRESALRFRSDATPRGEPNHAASGQEQRRGLRDRRPEYAYGERSAEEAENGLRDRRHLKVRAELERNRVDSIPGEVGAFRTTRIAEERRGFGGIRSEAHAEAREEEPEREKVVGAVRELSRSGCEAGIGIRRGEEGRAGVGPARREGFEEPDAVAARRGRASLPRSES